MFAGRLSDREYEARLRELIAQGDRRAVDAFMAAQGAREAVPGQIDAAIKHGEAGEVTTLAEKPKGMFGGNAEIKNATPDLIDTAGWFIADALKGIGMDNYEAHKLGRQIAGALDAVTPLGNVNSFLHSESELEQQLSVLPLPGPVRQAVGKGIRAFHGSPHDFDRFDLSKIGTGEGAQAYGHGLYFAENPAVAQQYADEVKNMGPIRDINVRLGELSREMDQYAIPGAYGQYRDPRGYELKAEYDRLMTDRSAVRQAPGRLYEVNINADPDSLLDWDRPLAEQGAIPQRFLGDELTRYLGPSYSRQIDNFTPREAGEILEHTRGRGLGGPKLSADARKAGIPGLQYLDQGSRGAGQGTRNYVIFDDSLIDIVSKR